MHRLSLSFHLLERFPPLNTLHFSSIVFSWFFSLFSAVPSSSLPLKKYRLTHLCILFTSFSFLQFPQLQVVVSVSSFLYYTCLALSGGKHISPLSLSLQARCPLLCWVCSRGWDYHRLDSYQQAAKSRFTRNARDNLNDERRGILCTITRVQQRVRNG